MGLSRTVSEINDDFSRKPYGAIEIDPGAAVTKSPPPVIFCQVGVSHIYVTESQPPVIFMPT